MTPTEQARAVFHIVNNALSRIAKLEAEVIRLKSALDEARKAGE